MGESFLGLPNRFKIVDNLLESTYNPNHMLSAYQGYRLGTDYLNRSGGEEFAMTGPLITKSLIPDENIYYGKYGSLYGNDIGSYDNKYRYIYALHLYGGADTATRLSNSILLSVTGAVTGSVSFNGSGNVTLNVTSSHKHDGVYLPLTGGAMTGNIKLNGNDIGLIDKNQRQILAEDSSNALRINRGPYNSNVGSLGLYSYGTMNLYTKQNDIRINIESSTHQPVKPYLSIGADTTGAYIKYSKNSARLYMVDNNTMLYNGHTVYHSGNLKYAPSDHNHDNTYLKLTGGNMNGVIRFSQTGHGIRDCNDRDILTYNTSEYSSGLYDIIIGKGLLGYSQGGKTIIYSHKNPVTIRTNGTNEALRLTSDGYSNMVIGSTTSNMYFASEYYGTSSMHRNVLAIPLKTNGELTYNNYTVYHSGNLKLSDYSVSNHTHDYIPNSDKVSVTTASHTNYPNNQSKVPTIQFLSYWNGAYNGTGGSNLAYCNKGKFGSIITKDVGDYLPSSGNIILSGSLTIGSSLSNVLKVYKITPPTNNACVTITRTGGEGTGDGSYLDAAIDDLACDRIVPTSIKTGTNSSSTGNITIGIDKNSKSKSKGLYVKYVARNKEVLDSNLNVIGASYTIGGYADVYCGALTCSSTAKAKSFATSSDIRLKEDVDQIDINQSIKILSKLSPVSYKFIESDDNSRNRGLIAQQLKEVMISEGCSNQVYGVSEDNNMSIDYTQLIPDIINVLKYLLYKVDKDSIKDIAESLKFNERYYREHAEEIANK